MVLNYLQDSIKLGLCVHVLELKDTLKPRTPVCVQEEIDLMVLQEEIVHFPSSDSVANKIGAWRSQ